MEKNIVTKTVTPSAIAAIGKAINLSGNIGGAGEYAYGIVKRANKAADTPAEIVAQGECYALVDGDSVDVSVEDKLKVDASGHLVKASAIGTLTDTGTSGATITIEESHIVALEANTGAAALKRVLVQ